LGRLATCCPATDRATLVDYIDELIRSAWSAFKGWDDGADQVRMARDVATMFDELKALTDRHAALHADQARLQAELDQARAELARARRPWWRLLIS
jgi:hypothetical protein